MIKKTHFLFHLFLRKIFQFIVFRQVASHKNELFVGGYTRLSKYTHLGRNPNFNGLKINGNGKVIIGDNFHSGTDCLLISSIHNYDHGNKIPYDHTHIEKPIIIEDNVWLGDRVTIIGKVTIGEGAIVQAGAVVVKDVPPFAIVGGNPAQIFKYRNIEHYNNLKIKKLFH
jgi:chloramphenicol O-acetyltransferase type B